MSRAASGASRVRVVLPLLKTGAGHIMIPSPVQAPSPDGAQHRLFRHHANRAKARTGPRSRSRLRAESSIAFQPHQELHLKRGENKSRSPSHLTSLTYSSPSHNLTTATMIIYKVRSCSCCAVASVRAYPASSSAASMSRTHPSLLLDTFR